MQAFSGIDELRTSCVLMRLSVGDRSSALDRSSAIDAAEYQWHFELGRVEYLLDLVLRLPLAAPDFFVPLPLQQPIHPLLPLPVESLQQLYPLPLVDDGVVDGVIGNQFEVPEGPVEADC